MENGEQTRNGGQAEKDAPSTNDGAKAPQQDATCKGGDEVLREKAAGLSERLLRLSAEFDNYKKRTAKEKERLSNDSEAKLVLRLLPVYEEAGLALAEAWKLSGGNGGESGAAKHSGEKQGVHSLNSGALMVLGKFRSALEKEGLQEMRLEGEKFDPFLHETALREESDAPDGTIVRTIQRGYLFRGSVLRHAIVAVSAGKGKEPDGKPGEKD